MRNRYQIFRRRGKFYKPLHIFVDYVLWYEFEKVMKETGKKKSQLIREGLDLLPREEKAIRKEVLRPVTVDVNIVLDEDYYNLLEELSVKNLLSKTDILRVAMEKVIEEYKKRKKAPEDPSSDKAFRYETPKRYIVIEPVKK